MVVDESMEKSAAMNEGALILFIKIAEKHGGGRIK